MASQIMTPKEIAAEWGISAKTLRKFLRSRNRAEGVETPGKGGRWQIARKDLRSLKKGFDAYLAELDAKRAAQAESDTEAESPELPPMLEGHENLEVPEGDDEVESLD